MATLMVAASASAQIVITEVMQNPSAVSDSNGEWFELYNAGASAVDLSGWRIKDDATASQTHTISGTLSIPAKGYLLFAVNGSSTSNGGLPAVDYVYTLTGGLGNSTDGLIITNASDVEQDRVVWDNGATFPDPNGASMALTAPDQDNGVGSNWCESENAWTGSAGDKGTPGAANDCPTPDPPPPPVTGEIFEIQGDGATSPHARALATTNDNVVTAVGAGGFFMQTPTSRSDNDVDTSDGIFVVHGGSPTISVGDQVDVVGEVQDGPGMPAYEFTRLDPSVAGGSVTIDASNQPLPAPVEFNPSRPSPNPAAPSCEVELECYEGMRVRIVTGTVASGSQHFGSDPVAEMYFTPGATRPFREPGIAYPGLQGLPIWDGNPEVFELDPDKLGLANVSWTPGSTFTAVGVLGYEFGGYELWPTQLSPVNAGPSLPRPVRAKAQGEITVASQNLLNLRGGAGATKLGKLSRFVRNVLLAPDVIAVQEVYGLAALQALAARINSDDSNVTYTSHVPAPGASRQAVGFLVRSGVTVNSVTEHGRTETFVDPRDNSNDTLHDRPPIVLDASVGDFDFKVIGIHNRSLSDVDSATRGGWVRTKRLEQAQSVARIVESMQDSKVVVVGDYNGYQFSDGYVDVVGQMRGVVDPTANLLSGPDLVSKDLCNLVDRLPAGERYSFVFGGNAQALDHALVNQELERHVVEMQYGRGNADAAGREADVAANALAASDHDGLVVYLSPTAKPPVSPSPCQAAAPLPPPVEEPEDPEGEPEKVADLSLAVLAEVVSVGRVRVRGMVRNEGPAEADNVVVSTAVSVDGGTPRVVTFGCDEDPSGVPRCSLGSVSSGRMVGYAFDVRVAPGTSGAITLRSELTSDNPDPTPSDRFVTVRRILGRPAAPSDLSATPISGTEIQLEWRDNSNNEVEFAIFLQGPGDGKLRWIGSAPANATSALVRDLVPNVTYHFAVEARNGSLRSGRTPTATAATWALDGARCGGDDVLCLGSFQVEVEWDAGGGNAGRGIAEQLTAESGDFWFFEPNNVEMVIKVLDGCALNGRYWVFVAGLTDVEVTTTVRDLRTGDERIWMNPRGTLFRPIADTSAFAGCGGAASASDPSGAVLSAAPRLGARLGEPLEASVNDFGGVGATDAACMAEATALCLQGSRYEVSAEWRASGQTGAAKGIQRTSDTGMFWFFSPDNVELVVKILDGCASNGHRWVLMGGLTDVAVDISVTDTVTGKRKMYGSPEGSPFRTMFDLTAFPCGAVP